MYTNSTADDTTFEATYPDYPFAPLVTAAIALARWLKTGGEDRYADGAAPTAMGTAS